MKKITRLPKGDKRILLVDIETKGPDIKGHLRKNIPTHEITVGVTQYTDQINSMIIGLIQ